MTTESICVKARRLALEEDHVKNLAKQTKRQSFLDALFAPGEYTLNEDGTYTICGWRWELWTGEEGHHPYLTFNAWRPIGWDTPPFNRYRGFKLEGQLVNDIISLGKALVAIDNEVANIDRLYPKTFFGNFKAYMERAFW